MRSPQQSSLSFALLLCLLGMPPVVLPADAAAQVSAPSAESGASDQQKREKAVALFGQGKRLEALPLLEALVQKNPRDGELLADLGASLIEHAATLADQDAAAKERFRAKDLVEKAWASGNASPLVENLRQLLRDLGAKGAITFSDNPAVDRVMNAGEAAFAQRDFDAALTAYAKALELEPTNYSATLFTANTYDRKRDLARAGEWYERAQHAHPRRGRRTVQQDCLARDSRLGADQPYGVQAGVSSDPAGREGWLHPDRRPGFQAAPASLVRMAILSLGNCGLARRQQVCEAVSAGRRVPAFARGRIRGPHCGCQGPANAQAR